MRSILCAFFILLLFFPLSAEEVLKDTVPTIQKHHPHSNLYEERFMVGLFIDFAHVQNEKIAYEYYFSGKRHLLNLSIEPFYGVSAYYPLNPWLALDITTGYQRLTIRHAEKSENFTLNERISSHNILFQAGFEMGIPLYSNKNRESMVKLSGLGAGTGGYGFFSGSEFNNPFIFGYSWGLGIRFAYRRLSLFSGFRMSHQYWRTYLKFNPSESEKKENTFMLDYTSSARPFISVHYSIF